MKRTNIINSPKKGKKMHMKCTNGKQTTAYIYITTCVSSREHSMLSTDTTKSSCLCDLIQDKIATIYSSRHIIIDCRSFNPRKIPFCMSHFVDSLYYNSHKLIFLRFIGIFIFFFRSLFISKTHKAY